MDLHTAVAVSMLGVSRIAFVRRIQGAAPPGSRGIAAPPCSRRCACRRSNAIAWMARRICAPMPRSRRVAPAASTRFPGSIPAIRRFWTASTDPPPVLWTRGSVGRARKARRRGRRLPRSDRHTRWMSRAARRRAGEARCGGRERAGARRGFGRAPRLPRRGRRHGCRPRIGARSDVSARARRIWRKYCK